MNSFANVAITLLVVIVAHGLMMPSPAFASPAYKIIFISSYGRDTNSGTAQSPLRSIRTAFTKIEAGKYNRISILGPSFVLDPTLEDPVDHSSPIYTIPHNYNVAIAVPASAGALLGDTDSWRIPMSLPTGTGRFQMTFLSGGQLAIENIAFLDPTLRLSIAEDASVSINNVFMRTDVDTAGDLVLVNTYGGKLLIQNSSFTLNQTDLAGCSYEDYRYWHRYIQINRGTPLNREDNIVVSDNNFYVPTYQGCLFNVVDIKGYPGISLLAAGNKLVSTGDHLHDESVGFELFGGVALENDLLVDNDFTQFWGIPLMGV